MEKAGGADKNGVFHQWRSSISPDYFYRNAKRRKQDVYSFERWSFARLMRDLDRRGEVVRCWLKGEKPHTANALWVATLTPKGRRNLKKYAKA